VFTGPPCSLGFQENPGSAAPVQHLLYAPSLESRSLVPTTDSEPPICLAIPVNEGSAACLQIEQK
jgi:hypothetical protein